MDLGIKGKVAVVTGGDSGMGLSSARFLAEAGCHIVLTDMEEGALAEAAATLTACGAEVTTVAADLTTDAGIARVAEAADGAGGTDILVHAAGITGPTGEFLTISDADWRKALDIDFFAAVSLCRALIPQMKAAGWGRIVLFCSEDAVVPYPDELPYCAAKAATLNLSKGLSKTYGKDGILVNAVSPAYVASPMTDAMMTKRAKERGESFDETIESFLKEERPHIEVKRRGRVDEVGAAVAFLCSEHASFIVGTNLRVDGGSVPSV